MRIYRSVITALGGLALISTGTVALAGSCGVGGPCNTGTVVQNFGTPQYDPTLVQVHQPFGHLSSVNYRRSPSVSITRVHGVASQAGLTDAPSGFTSGCHPTTTQYCRQNAGTPVNVQLNATPQATPVVRSPIVQQSFAAPVIRSAPSVDLSKFQSRQYGSTAMTPGTAYVPTSIVNRNPADAQAVLNSGRTVAQSTVLGGQAPGFSNTFSSSVSTSNVSSVSSGPVIATPPSGVPVSSVGPDGTYWEQVSGPTMFGDTLATKVVCKRPAPRIAAPAPVRVVHPVYRVPVPVRYPVPVTCAPAKVKAPSFGGFKRGGFNPALANTSRYGGFGSRWIQ